MLVNVKDVFVWPERRVTPRFQTKVKGPVPEATVLKMVVEPGQLVWLPMVVAVVADDTAKAAELVTELHAPETTTL